MIVKLLLDQGLPRSLPAFLAPHGIDAVHVAELGCSQADDSIILEKATSQQRAVVTLDADFHALLALANATSPSVIRLRIEGKKANDLAEILILVVTDFAEDLRQGAMITVQPERIRIRRLPMVRDQEN
jgi:predicted nuclease of predicted toxin-antitoxin system